jgi:hypothetical protein
VPNGLGVPTLLALLGAILRQAAATIETQPDSFPEEAATSPEILRCIAARADFLAGQIAGEC